MKYLFYRHSIILLPAPSPPRNINAQDKRKTPPTHLGHPGRKSSPVPVRRPAAHPQSAGHVREQGRTTESVLQHPRAASEVPPRRGSFRPGSPRFCPAGGRAPAAPPQPVRESRAARAPASPRPATPFPSLLSGLGRVLGAIVTSSALREAPFRREGEGEARPGPRGQLLPSELALGRGRTGIRPGFLDCS